MYYTHYKVKLIQKLNRESEEIIHVVRYEVFSVNNLSVNIVYNTEQMWIK